MDFKFVFEKLLTFFHENNVRYALMGGFALGLHGVARSTVDIDFLVHRDDLAKIQVIMSELGYKCVYESENVSQYVSSLKVFGEVDFIHAFRQISLKMLERVEEKKVFNETISVKVLKPEDIFFMMPEDEKQERAELSQSVSIRDDMRRLVENRHNPFIKDGKVDLDRYIDFLNGYNEFINHTPKPFKPMQDRIMKL